MAWCAKGTGEVARVVLASCCRPCEATRSIPNGATTATGLHEAAAAAERSGTAARISTAGIFGTGETARRVGRVRHRVRVCAGSQDARSMEIQHSTRLDEPVAGGGGMETVDPERGNWRSTRP